MHGGGGQLKERLLGRHGRSAELKKEGRYDKRKIIAIRKAKGWNKMGEGR